MKRQQLKTRCIFLILMLVNIGGAQNHMENLQKNPQHQRVLKTKNQQNLAKTAYLIFCTRGESEKVIQLLNKIIYRENIYLLHVDKKTSVKEVDKILQHAKNLNETYQNIYFLNQLQASYLGISLVDIEITAMAYALSISMHWTHYINLSPSHYPLLSQKQIQIILGKIPKNISFIQGKVMGCNMFNGRIRHVNFDGALMGFNTNQQLFTGGRLPQPKNLTIFKDSQWRIFSREMTEYFVHSEDGLARRILLLFANSMMPNEHYFQTTICNSPVVNQTARIAEQAFVNWKNIDWNERLKAMKLGPNQIDENLLEKALNKGTLFARKFSLDDQSQILKNKLDRLHEGEQIQVMNTTFTQKRVFQTAPNYYLNAVAADDKICDTLIKNHKPDKNCEY